MKTFLHLDDKLIVIIENINAGLYYNIIEKLKLSNIKIKDKTKVLDSGYLPKISKSLNIDNWKFKFDHYFAMTDESGNKVVFIPEIHLDYIKTQQSRQGFHLFFEFGKFCYKNEITLKFFYESNKLFTVTVETFKALIEKLFSFKNRGSKRILNKDMQVVLEHSQNFYLTSENDLKILKSLYLENAPKIKIVLKKPKSKIFFLFEGQNEEDYIKMPYLKSYYILLFLLRNDKDLKSMFELKPNIDDPNIYAQLEPNSQIIISPIKLDLNSPKKVRCRCGGRRINNRCSVINCRYN